MRTIEDLLDELPQVGRLDWIGISGATRSAIRAIARVEVRVGTGLEGDHHARSGRGHRQVTLIQAEHLPVIARLCGKAEVGPEMLRRNLAVSGINLHALRDRRFRIGTVVLEGTGSCDPCSRLAENLGPGGYNAARGHSGITARVLEGGTLALGDTVQALDRERPSVEGGP